MSSPREWNAESYHRISNFQFEWGLAVLGRLKLRGGETVLDAGCGSGRVTKLLAERLPHGCVLGLDRSENMVRTADGEKTCANVRFVCGDMLELPLRAAFDGVFSTAAFHWVLDHERLFAQLFSVLKPGGWLEAQCGGGPNIAGLVRTAKQVLAQAPFAEIFRGWREEWFFAGAEDTAHRLQRAGFTGVKTCLESRPAVFETPAHFHEFCATITLRPYVAHIGDSALADRFLDEVMRRHPHGQHYEIDYWRLNISARKPWT